MMQATTIATLSCAALLFLNSQSASAQPAEVEVTEDGVKVKVGGTEVKTGAGGVHIKTRGAKVRTRKTGMGPAVSVTVGAGGRNMKLKRRGPIICKGNREMSLSNVYIETNGNGLVIKGNCDVTLMNSRIEADKHAVRVQGNANLKLKNCHIVGGKTALKISGNGDVTASNSFIKGRIAVSGNADFERASSNRFER